MEIDNVRDRRPVTGNLRFAPVTGTAYEVLTELLRRSGELPETALTDDHLVGLADDLFQALDSEESDDVEFDDHWQELETLELRETQFPQQWNNRPWKNGYLWTRVFGRRFSKETNMPDLEQQPNRPPPVPKEYGGKWIAWNQAGNEIIASGDTLEEAKQAAGQTDEQRPRYEKVPRADVRIIGAAR